LEIYSGFSYFYGKGFGRIRTLRDYIVENEITTKLDKVAVEKLGQAFLALATMDKEFQSSAKKI
jgi:hypothetical protein